jgi:transcription-repair coupling factor (superfamily II helicase)
VENIAERLSLYQRLDECEEESALQIMQQELIDRFGPLPESVVALLDTVRCRKLAVELGFEKMSLKDKTLRCFFINRPDSPYFESDTFRRILDYLQTGTNRAKLKQTGRLFLLVVEGVADMAELLRLLKIIHEGVFKKVGF